MQDTSFFRNPRRRFFLYSALLFASGTVVGILFGIFGLRYIFFRFPPDSEQMVMRTADRIQEAFGLDSTARTAIEAECRLFHSEAKAMIMETRRSLDARMQQRAENMAHAFPTPEARKKWLSSYSEYFHKGPPPPFGPPPPHHTEP